MTSSDTSSVTPKSASARDSEEDSNRWVEPLDECVCDERLDCRLDDRFIPETDEAGHICEEASEIVGADR